MTGWLPDGTAEWGGRPVARSLAAATARSRVSVTGTVCAVVVRTTAPPSVEAVLQDGTGRLGLCWIGRDAVAGIAPGRTVAVEGTVLERRGRLVVLNPLYRFVAGAP